MQTRHILISLLVAAHILVALAIVVWVCPRGRPAVWVLLPAVPIGQIGLLSIWTVFGHRAAPWRPVVLIATVVAWSFVMDAKGLWLLVWFLSVAMATVAILAIVRGFGVRLVLLGATPVEKEGPWQFSLARLFGWTTSLAICLSLLSLSFKRFNIEPNDFFDANELAVTVVVTGFILISPSLAWMRPRFSYTVATAIFALIALLLFAYWFFGPSIFGKLVTLCGLELLFVVGSLVVVRVAGYRWGRG